MQIRIHHNTDYGIRDIAKINYGNTLGYRNINIAASYRVYHGSFWLDLQNNLENKLANEKITFFGAKTFRICQTNKKTP